MCPRHQRLGEQSGQQRRVELNQVRKVHVERLVQSLFYDRMPASEREDTETRQEVEIALSIPVVQVRAFSPHVEAIETEGLQHLHELGIEILTVEAEILALAGFDQRAELEGHRLFSSAVAFRQSVVAIRSGNENDPGSVPYRA